MDGITIKVFPASNGDCILIRIGSYNMLIDGGYVDTYKNHIKQSLLFLNSKGLSLGHLVVSHIDKDHISGIIKLIEENGNSEVIKIENIWHNSYRHISKLEKKGLPNHKEKSEAPLLPTYLLSEEKNERTKDVSAKQGSTLASLIIKSGYKWNQEFANNAISVDNCTKIELKEGITLLLLSPNNEMLYRLARYWRKEIYKLGYSYDPQLKDFNEDLFEQIVARQKARKNVIHKTISNVRKDILALSQLPFIEDSASANGSSISFVIETNNKKFLFLGDSLPSLIVKNLRKHYPGKGKIFFDLIKVSHHGSKNNTSPELLATVESSNYIFSTNGKTFGHPDHETVARIICSESSIRKKLFFNYHLDSLEIFEDESLMQEWNYEIIQPKERSEKAIEFKFNE